MLLGHMIGEQFVGPSVFVETVYTHAHQSHECLAVVRVRREKTIELWDANGSCRRCTRNLEFRKREVKFFASL